jgi:hypothetical protein
MHMVSELGSSSSFYSCLPVTLPLQFYAPSRRQFMHVLFFSPNLLHELDSPLRLIPRRDIVVDDEERLRL